LARHHAINDLIAWAFASAGIPVTKEALNSLLWSDGKQPNGLTLIPWQAGQALTWDVTVMCLLAESYVHTVVQDAGAVGELAAAHKTAKYAALESRYVSANCGGITRPN